MGRDRNNFSRNGNGNGRTGGRGGRDFYGNSRNRGWNAGADGSAQGAGNLKKRMDHNARNRRNNNAYDADDGFTKFRDPQQQQQRPYNNMQQRRQSNFGACWSGRKGRGGGGGGGGGGANWYVDGSGAKTAERNVENSGELGQPAQQSELPQLTTTSEALTSTATAPFTRPTTPATTATPVNLNASPADTDTVEDKKPLLHNIKKEKLDQIDTKPPPPPPSNSSDGSSSSDSSSTEAPVEDLKPAKQKSKPVLQNTKVLSNEVVAKSSSKTSQKKLVEPASSSSSSSSSDEEDTGRNKEQLTPAPTPAKVVKKKLKRKLSSEEDLVCLGKMEKNFVIEDEDEPDEMMNEDDSKKQQCILCDRKGHTAFQCQMICKNCAAPYHNHKSCPKPANLTVMMQSFMEFCMSQLWQYSPEQRFAYAQNLSSNGSADMANFAAAMPTSPAPSSAHSKRKHVQRKSKSLPKKSSKRKRSHVDNSDDDTEADEQEEASANTTTESTESETDSELSAKVTTASKTKMRPQKVPTPQDYRSPFVPHGSLPTAFTGFPPFGAAAPAYNPMLFGQMMHGTFPPLSGLNFK